MMLEIYASNMVNQIEPSPGFRTLIWLLENKPAQAHTQVNAREWQTPTDVSHQV